MHIQLTTPRPLFNLSESPEHIVIFTLRKVGTSKGDVWMNMNTDIGSGVRETIEVTPFEVFPIDGEPNFEAVQYYLPFDTIYGTHRTEYNEQAAMQSWEKGMVRQSRSGQQKIPDTILALLGASGFNIIAKSAYRSDTNAYEERVFNFQMQFPVSGGGIIRVTGSTVDILNPTFQPKAVIPVYERPDQDMRNAYNRTHQLMPASVEARRQARLAGIREMPTRNDLKKLGPKS